MISFLQFINEGKRDPQLSHLYDDNYYHHTTSTSNLPEIKKHGLVSGKKSTFQEYDGNNEKIHLTKDLDATEYWHGMINHAVTGSINPSDKTTLLRARKDKIKAIPSYRYDEVLANKIEPEYLEHYHQGKWKAL